MRVLSKRTLALRAPSMAFLLAALVAGCIAPGKRPALDQAGAAVERARSAPRVRALAAAELDRAEAVLEYARGAARAGAAPDQVEHMAYIVKQRAALAEARAAERVARSEVEELQRALDRVVAQKPPVQDRHSRTPRKAQQDRASVAQDEPARSPLEQDQRQGGWGAEERQTRGPLEQAQPEGASVQVELQTRTRLEQDQRERAAAQEDPRARMPLEQDRGEGAPVQEERQTRAPLEQDRGEGALVQEGRRTRAPLVQDQLERAAAQEDQRARTPLEQDRGEGAPVQDGRRTRAARNQDQLEGAPVQEDRQPRAALEQDQPKGASAHEHRQAVAALEQEPRERASVEEDQQAPTIESGIDPAMVETMPQDITLSLAKLPFEGAEPTSDTIEQLTVLAERLLREPGSSVSIEVNFELPDPEARTVMERRVEVVRAILVQRGIAPARLVVRAGAGPLQPPAATPSIVGSPY